MNRNSKFQRGNQATEEIKAHLRAIRHWMWAWVDPLVAALEPNPPAYIRSYVLAAGAKAKKAEEAS